MTGMLPTIKAMDLKLPDYIFEQIVAIRRTAGWNPREAIYTAIAFMTVPWIALAIAIDFVIAYALETQPVAGRIGKWSFGIVVFVVSFWAHYKYFTRNASLMGRIGSSSSPPARTVSGLISALMYVFLVPVLTVVLGLVLRN